MINKYGIAICVYLTSSIAIASNLGVIGQIYPIIETDFLDFIQTRLKAMQSNGELSKIENKFRENVAKHADRPQPILSITTAETNKSWMIDPSLITPYDLTDANGRIFAKAGTTINPLNYIAIHHPMVFINADNMTQVKWVQKLVSNDVSKIKLVLVNGSVSGMAKMFHQPIYFDQEGKLTTKFHIQHVPAIVSQKGMKLKVEEVCI